MSLTHKIEKILEAKRIGKTEFAASIGVHRDTVYKWTDENLKVSLLQKISDYLEVPIERFFEKDGNILKEPPVQYQKSDCNQLKQQNEFLLEQNAAHISSIKALTGALEAITKKINSVKK